jgi:hypothetical protein
VRGEGNDEGAPIAQRRSTARRTIISLVVTAKACGSPEVFLHAAAADSVLAG